MIQRIQTLWLALAALAAVLTLRFSVFSGNKKDAAQVLTWKELTATSNLIIAIFTIAVAVIAAIVIFLYKNRRLQLRLSLLSLLLTIIILALYYYETKKFAQGKYDLTALVALSIPVFLLLAIRGIYKDDRLIKNADRLR